MMQRNRLQKTTVESAVRKDYILYRNVLLIPNAETVFEQIVDVDGFVSFKSICKYLKVGNTLYAE